jgi:hypothetical protein
LTAELQSLERTLVHSSLSLADRHGILVRRARLLTLTGNLDAAAAAWLEAAFANPESWDDGSLLEGARCFIALGEFDKAETHIRTVLLTGKDPHTFQARYLGAYVEAFRSGNSRVLVSLLEDPLFRDKRPAILYTLWFLFGSGTHKNRLLAEFPSSPEARILQGEGDGIHSSALWFLYPGREGLRLAAPIPVQPSGHRPQSSPPNTNGSALQTGLFGSEDNARVMVIRLRNSGFTASVSTRTVNSRIYWAVTVPSGPDMKETILRLKSAGFDAFPVP